MGPRRTLRLVAAILLAAFALLPPAHADDTPARTLTVEHEDLGPVAVSAPAGDPQRFVILVTDGQGIDARATAATSALVGRGAAVATIDLPALRKRLAADDGDCHYAFGDFEDLARVAQRQLGMATWRWPILLGLGEGGTLAYLALAQAPDNTAGGAVSVGFSRRFATKKPLCAGAKTASVDKQGIAYEPSSALPAPWIVVLGATPDAATKAFVDADGEAEEKVVPGSDADRLASAVDAVFALEAPVAEGLADLPITELPAEGDNKISTLVVLLSGDGGWRDIDKQIGEYLSEHGVPVVGLDSLRYFWAHKEAGQIASDLDRIVEHYAGKWGTTSIALVGYSFGADAIPMAWSKLAHETQARTRVIALLGLEPTIDLEVSVSGWLGLSTARDIDVRPFLTSLPRDRVLCFYGKDEVAETETACILPEIAGATLIERPGGHHFDGNYEILAQTILDRIRTVPGGKLDQREGPPARAEQAAP